MAHSAWSPGIPPLHVHVPLHCAFLGTTLSMLCSVRAGSLRASTPLDKVDPSHWLAFSLPALTRCAADVWHSSSIGRRGATCSTGCSSTATGPSTTATGSGSPPPPSSRRCAHRTVTAATRRTRGTLSSFGSPCFGHQHACYSALLFLLSLLREFVDTWVDLPASLLLLWLTLRLGLAVRSTSAFTRPSRLAKSTTSPASTSAASCPSSKVSACQWSEGVSRHLFLCASEWREDLESYAETAGWSRALVLQAVVESTRLDKTISECPFCLPLAADFPAQYIYEPWKAPLEVQKAANCIIGVDYPGPSELPHRPNGFDEYTTSDDYTESVRIPYSCRSLQSGLANSVTEDSFVGGG